MIMGNNGNKDILGCDIGNGFGFVSLLQEVNSDPFPMFPAKYKLTPLGMPTSAYIAPPDGTKIEVFCFKKSGGRAAIKEYSRNPERFVHAAKTRLKEGKIHVPGIAKTVSADAIYAAIARDLIALANEQCRNMGKDPVYDVVFTFPAAFSDDLPLLNRMQSGIESVELDGRKIKVIGRLPEPAAAAIDYLHYMQNIAPEHIRISEDHFTVLVYDLGHGTFDTAVVTARSKGEPYQVLAKSGLPEIGGKDFDDILYREICRILKERCGYVPKNEEMRAYIRSAAANMKHELSDSESGMFQLLVQDGSYVDIEITREQFEELSWHLLSQTLELVKDVLEGAAVRGIVIDAIVLSGGASQMPMVINNLNKLVAEENISVRVYRPSEAVSYGAARYAYGLRAGAFSQPENGCVPSFMPEIIRKQIPSGGNANTVLEQFTDHCYGIWLPSEKKLSGNVHFIVKSGIKLPAVSESVPIISASGRVVLKLYRSKEKDTNIEIAEVEQCTEIMRIPFDIPCNTICEVRIVVLEDYNVKVVCSIDNETSVVKSTADGLDKLV